MRPSPNPPLQPLSPEDRLFLRNAAEYLERPSFLIRVANVIGRPAEALFDKLPRRAQAVVGDATSRALHNALEWAVLSLPQGALEFKEHGSLRSWLNRHAHTALAASTGAIGGFFGLTGIAFEVPATTTVMLRSIARIAADSGADLSDPLTRLQCLSVFSFGSPSLEKMESAYWTGRLSVAMTVQDAARFVAQHGAREVSEALAKDSAPVLVRLINVIAGRFQVVVTQKLAAQAVPIAGAASGALINAAFTDHFNAVARFHFGIVRLERLHGHDVVQAAYQEARLNRMPAAE